MESEMLTTAKGMMMLSCNMGEDYEKVNAQVFEVSAQVYKVSEVYKVSAQVFKVNAQVYCLLAIITNRTFQILFFCPSSAIVCG
jgi:hypothetical protein